MVPNHNAPDEEVIDYVHKEMSFTWGLPKVQVPLGTTLTSQPNMAELEWDYEKGTYRVVRRVRF